MQICYGYKDINGYLTALAWKNIWKLEHHQSDTKINITQLTNEWDSA